MTCREPVDLAAARARLILAVDVADVDQARTVVDHLSADVGVIKIGLELIYAGGLAFAEELVDRGLKVFLDAKLHDIGHTVERATARIADLGVAMLTVHAADAHALAAAVRGRGKAPMKLLGITVLTNLTDQDLAAQGITASVAELIRARARAAHGAGLDGVVCSPLEVADVKATWGPGFLAVAPGVRPVGAALGDQSRVMTPGEAITAGADYLVVGRPILASADPQAAARAIVQDMAANLRR